MAANGAGNDGPPPAGGDGLPVPDLRTMEEFCQPTLNGRGGPIALIAIQTTNFTLKNDMIQQVQNSCPFQNVWSIHENEYRFILGFRKLPSNTITNPREDLKGIATRSGVAYKGPTIPTTYSSPKVVERETELKLKPNSEPVVAPVVKPVEAPVSAPKPNPKPSIPYPSRLNDQKLREKANNQMEKFFQIFQDCISTIASRMTHILKPKSFLKTRRALINVYARELTLRVGNKAVTFNLDQTSRYSSNYDDISVNRIDVIDVACEEYSQEVLGFSVSGNPTPTSDPIVSTSSPTLTPFGDSDFLLEETDAFLAIEDEPISPEIDDSYYDSGTDKLPVIIAKDLKDKEKAALIKVLKSHKQAIAWKLIPP
ncbi:hypothetical protein Tco_1025516 [Tanacetum coccineum]